VFELVIAQQSVLPRHDEFPTVPASNSGSEGGGATGHANTLLTATSNTMQKRMIRKKNGLLKENQKDVE
jgi:hypothetical protein